LLQGAKKREFGGGGDKVTQRGRPTGQTQFREGKKLMKIFRVKTNQRRKERGDEIVMEFTDFAAAVAVNACFWWLLANNLISDTMGAS
jgi:hypothetical protein